MQLNFARRGKDGDITLRMLAINRSHTLFDFGFRQAGDAQVADVEAPAVT